MVSPPPSPHKMPALSCHFIPVLRVADVAASGDWYRRVLGLIELSRHPRPGETVGQIVSAEPTTQLTLCLVGPEDAMSRAFAVERRTPPASRHLRMVTLRAGYSSSGRPMDLDVASQALDNRVTAVRIAVAESAPGFWTTLNLTATEMLSAPG